MECIPAKALRFATVADYIRTLHPEYEFVFHLREHARERWHYSLKQAELTQANMIENACEVAMRMDHGQGLSITIDELAAEENGSKSHGPRPAETKERSQSK
jgi:hypothetical protein